jgi:hypothetical protein
VATATRLAIKISNKLGFLKHLYCIKVVFFNALREKALFFMKAAHFLFILP